MRVLALSTAIACAMPALSAAAAGPSTPLALSCTTCHVSSMTQAASIPSLSGLSPLQIAEALRDYASGERKGTIMPRLAPALSEADIAALAAYFGRAGAEAPDAEQAP